MEELRELILSNNKLIILLSVVIVLDIITGVVNAIMEKTLKSSEFRKGLLKKLLDIILIIMSIFIDWAFELNIILNGVSVALFAMESYSILENISNYIPIPVILKDFIDNSKNYKEDYKNENI